MKDNIIIGNKIIGSSSPVFIIAEIGVNHNGSMEIAKKLIDYAKGCGADCVKFQTFKAERVVTKSAPKAKYQLGTTDKSESQIDMLRKIELKPEDYAALKDYAEKSGMVFLSTPYNFEDIELLEKVGISAYKIASGQIVEQVFLHKIAQTGKPIFLSTGMATLAEVDSALAAINETGNGKVILLQCTTNYPSRIEDANLSVIQTFKKAFDVVVGYSDHTLGEEAAIASVAMGAKVIEKHFTLDKNLPGPDHSSSMTPEEFKSLTEKIRRVEASLGIAQKKPSEIEKENALGMRRSIVASCNIRKGDMISERNITFKRPATGLHPRFYDTIIGKKTSKNIDSDEIIQMDMIEW